jgi:uncharacterized membrane protein
MLKMLVAYIATAAIFLVADGLWLSTVATAIYRPRLAGILSEQVFWPAAIAFYLLYIVGLLAFGVAPALESGRWTSALLAGAGFGFFCYATYDLTNLATVRGWSTTVTVLDIAWGTVLSGIASAGGYLVTNAVLRATAQG